MVWLVVFDDYDDNLEQVNKIDSVVCDIQKDRLCGKDVGINTLS